MHSGFYFDEICTKFNKIQSQSNKIRAKNNFKILHGFFSLIFLDKTKKMITYRIYLAKKNLNRVT